MFPSRRVFSHFCFQTNDANGKVAHDVEETLSIFVLISFISSIQINELKGAKTEYKVHILTLDATVCRVYTCAAAQILPYTHTDAHKNKFTKKKSIRWKRMDFLLALRSILYPPPIPSHQLTAEKLANIKPQCVIRKHLPVITVHAARRPAIFVRIELRMMCSKQTI